MNDKGSNINRARKFCYSIESVMERYGLDQWTVRMWVDRFGLEHLSVDDSSILFTPHSAKQIGIICGLMKKKMKLEDVRKYLDSVSGNCD